MNIADMYGTNTTNERTVHFCLTRYFSGNFYLVNEACGRRERKMNNDKLPAIERN